MKLSQNFLIDDTIAERLVKYARVSDADVVLEVGPGHGIITNEIRKKTPCLMAVEKDKHLAKRIAKLFPQIDVIKGDAVKVELPDFDKVISNLPFEISSPFIFRLANLDFSTAVLIVQKEFAERLFGKPGTKKYSRLTLTANYYFSIEKLENISRKKFSPVPKVDACIIRLKRKPPAFPSSKQFWTFVNKVFQHKRKKVRAALKKKYPKEKIATLPPKLNKRVDNLTIKDLKNIYEHLSKMQKD
jgi:16S rRNA (adenine1518-N6/adenine1519-N6)-dimethyltransferase